MLEAQTLVEMYIHFAKPGKVYFVKEEGKS